MLDAGDAGVRGGQARRALRDAAPRLSADQAERALSRMREASLPADNDTVAALLDRLEEAGGKRRAAKVRGWFGKAGDVAERRARRQDVGTVKEQRSAYADYVRGLAARLEEVTKGQAVAAGTRSQHARGQGLSLEQILTSTPATMRKHLSEESLRALAEQGPPLTFDAWRYANLGARDSRAVASWQKRTGGYLSEHG